MKQYYILFDNHTDGMAMHQMLKENKIESVIAPTPRALSVCCGISILINEQDRLTIINLAKELQMRYAGIEGIEQSFQNKRDRYC